MCKFAIRKNPKIMEMKTAKLQTLERFPKMGNDFRYQWHAPSKNELMTILLINEVLYVYFTKKGPSDILYN